MIFMHITGTKYHFRARGKDKTFSYKLRVEKYFHLQSMQYLSLKLIIYHSNEDLQNKTSALTILISLVMQKQKQNYLIKHRVS